MVLRCDGSSGILTLGSCPLHQPYKGTLGCESVLCFVTLLLYSLSPSMTLLQYLEFRAMISMHSIHVFLLILYHYADIYFPSLCLFPGRVVSCYLKAELLPYLASRNIIISVFLYIICVFKNQETGESTANSMSVLQIVTFMSKIYNICVS